MYTHLCTCLKKAKKKVPDPYGAHLWALTPKHTCMLALLWVSRGWSWVLLGLGALLNNGYWGEVKPLAVHDLVAEGSGIKTQGVLGIVHDKSFHRVTPGHHTLAFSCLIKGKELDLWIEKGIWCQADIVPQLWSTLCLCQFTWTLHLAKLNSAFYPIYNTAIKVSLQLCRAITEELIGLYILCNSWIVWSKMEDLGKVWPRFMGFKI